MRETWNGILHRWEQIRMVTCALQGHHSTSSVENTLRKQVGGRWSKRRTTWKSWGFRKYARMGKSFTINTQAGTRNRHWWMESWTLTNEEMPRDIQLNIQLCGRRGNPTQKLIKQTTELFTWNREDYLKLKASEIKRLYYSSPFAWSCGQHILWHVKHYKKQPKAATENWPNNL